jgi:subtilisin family serine protease
MSVSTKQIISKYEQRHSKITPTAMHTGNDSALNTSDADALSRVSVFVHVDSGFNELALNALDAAIGTKTTSILTINLPIKHLNTLVNLNGVRYVNAGGKARPLLRNAAVDIGADKVWTGAAPLENGYTGKNVVVGVIDWGFDLTHPTFYKDGNLKVKRLWIQDRTGNVHPQGFNYGVEYIGADIRAVGTSNRAETHGTHVAGIAAGTGGSLGIYKGIAPDADIVLVELSANGRDANFVDGIKYIFNYAESVGKPAVVNISFGHHWGPHNGTSDLDKQIDALSTAGHIVVGAAGNEGDVKLHARHFFNSSATVRIAATPDDKDGGFAAVVEPAANFEWWIEVWDKSQKKKLHTYPTQPRRTADYGGIDNYSTQVNGKNITITAQSYAANATIYPRAYIWVEFTNSDPDGLAVTLVCKASTGTLHVWNGYGKNLFAAGNASIDGWLVPDNDFSVGEIGGTARSIITAGAYNLNDFCTQNLAATNVCSPAGGFYAIAASRRTPASFSSRGSTADGRVKPNVIAPGSMIVSAVNSFAVGNADYVSCRQLPAALCDNPASCAHCYYMMSGTSMAAPMVTGAVALMLDADPNLRPDTLMGLLHKYADLDAALVGYNTQQRGYGKVRIFSVLANINDRSDLPIVTVDFNIVPNPNSGNFHLVFSGDIAQAQFYTITGMLVYEQLVMPYQELWLPPLAAGVYILSLRIGAHKQGKKMLLVR